MKPAVLLFGLACAVLAPVAYARTEAVKKSPKKPVVTRAAHAKAVKSLKPLKLTKPTKRAAKQKKVPVGPASLAHLAEKPANLADKVVPNVSDTPDDDRELVPMPSPARLAMRAEMRDRMVALDSVLQLMHAGKTKEAGEIARDRLGVAVWSNHRKLPKAAQPEQYMVTEMQTLAVDGYKAASDFATVAVTGDQATAIALLPQLTGSCAQCHKAYRIR